MNLLKKCLVGTVLLGVITTAYIVTRNKRSFHSIHVPKEQIIGSKKNFTLKLSAKLRSRIQTLALFIGYPRSGHTLIGSLLDAHPHIVISNELDIFHQWRKWTDKEKTKENVVNKMYENSYKQSLVGIRSKKKHSKSYAVPNQWQGKYKDYIQVIGDKKGEITTKFLTYYPKIANEFLNEMHLPLKLIHMVRNPYDNIATMITRSKKIRTRDAFALKHKIDDSNAMKKNLSYYLRHAHNNQKLIKKFGRRVLTLHNEDVISDPKKQLKKLCAFLEISCSVDYLNDCASIIYKSTSKTRTTVVWPNLAKQSVDNAIKNIPFLRRYSFES